MQGTPEEVAEKHISDIADRFLRDSFRFEDAINRANLDIRETMRNLALGSGALAAASLVLLSSNIQVNTTFALVGIIVLMLESALAFIWLLRVQTISVHTVIRQRYETLSPASKILTSHHEYITNKKSKEDFFKELKEYVDRSNNKATKYYEEEQNEPEKGLNVDAVFIVILIVGVVCLALGLIMPHLGRASRPGFDAANSHHLEYRQR